MRIDSEIVMIEKASISGVSEESKNHNEEAKKA